MGCPAIGSSLIAAPLPVQNGVIGALVAELPARRFNLGAVSRLPSVDNSTYADTRSSLLLRSEYETHPRALSRVVRAARQLADRYHRARFAAATAVLRLADLRKVVAPTSGQ
jgi:hypothetical protein